MGSGFCRLCFWHVMGAEVWLEVRLRHRLRISRRKRSTVRYSRDSQAQALQDKNLATVISQTTKLFPPYISFRLLFILFDAISQAMRQFLVQMPHALNGATHHGRFIAGGVL